MKKDKSNRTNKIQETEEDNYMVIGMSIGTGIGIAIGTAIDILTNNVGICMCFGVNIGMMLGMAIGCAIKKDEKNKK